MELLYKLCWGLTTVFGISLGLFVLCKNYRSRVNVTWALTNFALAAWVLGMIAYCFELDYEQSLLKGRVANYVVVFIPVFFTHFCLALRDKPLRESRLAVAGYVFAIGMGAFFLTPWFVPSVSPKLIFPHYVNPGPLYVAFTIQFFVLAIYAHWVMLWRLHRLPRKRQNQIKYVASATIIGFLCGSTTFLPVYDVAFNPIPSLFTPIYALIITYAIVKHQLLDIKIAITRTGILLATYLVVLGVPFMVGWWGRERLYQQIGTEWWLVPVGLCTALATAGPFAYAYLRRQAESRLLSEQRRYQRTLQHAARGMTQVRDINRLSNLITRVVSKAVGLTHASLLLWDKTTQRYVLQASHGPKRLALQSGDGLESSHPLIRWLRQHHRVLTEEDAIRYAEPRVSQAMERLSAVLTVPGLIEHHLVGFLVLGPKLSNDSYSPDDWDAFTTLANEAAIAIENAFSYEELLKVNQQLKVASERLLVQERLAAAGQFATGMAHEIKNPLSAIKTFAQYLPEKYADPAFREKFFRIVQAEIDRINDIVKELSDFAKPAPLELQPVRVAELVDDTLSLLSNQCLKQGVEVKRSYDEDGLLVQADPQQMKQMLLNLLFNSLEAMPDGGRLEVITKPNRHYLTLRIADTGCGITSEHQQQVWNPFFTTKERGTGLGLPIVKGVVERHGGQITICSMPGQGTKVELNLPLAAGPSRGRQPQPVSPA